MIACEDYATNYASVLQKAKAITKIWKQRNLSLVGKITVTNALIGSLFTYKMQVLPAIPKDLVTKFNRIIEIFIWHGREPKIKTAVLQCDKKDGRLNLVDLNVKNMSLKIQWISKLHTIYPVLTKLAHYIIKPKICDQLF